MLHLCPDAELGRVEGVPFQPIGGDTHAKGLVNLSNTQTLEDCVYSVNKLRLLYEQSSTSEELAVLYANGLAYLSSKQAEEVDVQESTRKAKELLSRYHKNTEMQLLYAQALFNLTLKQEPETLHQTVARLREFLLAYPEANQRFQNALDIYLNEHPDHTERYISLKV